MSKGSFVYVSYIATTSEKVWQALTDPVVTRRWYRVTAHAIPLEHVSDWKPGSSWQRRRRDEVQTIDIVGRVLESRPPHRLVLTWARPEHLDDSEMNSRVTFASSREAKLSSS